MPSANNPASRTADFTCALGTGSVYSIGDNRVPVISSGAWPPSRIISWAASIGPSVGSVVERILADKPHPEQGYRSCMALIRTAKQYGHERTEAACKRALAIGAPTRKSVEAILKRGLDRAPLDEPDAAPRIVVHENIRGGDYFDKKEDGDDPGRNDQEVA